MKRVLKLHLAVALFCIPFLCIYALDGVRSGHRDWLENKPLIESIVQGAHHLHVTAGIHGKSASATYWGILVLLVSVGLIVLGLSGLLLWSRRLKERRWGLLFLVCSVGYGSICLFLIYTA